jgi:putative flippase GtrA
LSTVRDLYQRFRQLIHEGAKFLVVGAIGTVVTFGVANALRKSVGEYGAITIATVLATIVTYIGNGYWAFKARQGRGTARDTVLFFVLNGIGLVIYYLCIWLFKDVVGLKGAAWYNFELVLGTGLGTLFRFWSYRKWVWKAVPADGASGWAAAYADAEQSSPEGQPPVGPPAEELPADSRSPVSQPWNGPKHRSPAGRR